MSNPTDQLAKSETGYVGQRAELLAQLVLTRRKDVEVISVGEAFDTGIDLFVRIRHPVMNGQVLPMFGVQVKGTNEPVPNVQFANSYINAGLRHRQTKGLFLFPLVLFLFTMDGDIGYYSWLMKPTVLAGNGPALARVESFEMAKIDKHSIDKMISHVIKWFDAMGEILGRKE
jgi:hypothetical protein